jgi:hypothetical protein
LAGLRRRSAAMSASHGSRPVKVSR